MAENLASRSTFMRPPLLLAASVLMLTLAFAPIDQFYLAWIALAPWLIFLSEARSQKSAFFWSWIAGTAFFIANMWWMAAISWPGMLALLSFCGLFWGATGAAIRGAGIFNAKPLWAILGIATLWTASEWLRGIIFTGLPWLFIGFTQTPILPMCQIADLGGSYVVTFWVLLVNAGVALAWIRRNQLRSILPSFVSVGVITLLSLLYGLWRMQQTDAFLSPGPTLAVVQSNYPQNNRGEKPVKVDKRLQFHADQTLDVLRQHPGSIDMVVWSETMMDALNAAARVENPEFQQVFDAISALARDNHVAILTGGLYYGDWKDEAREDGIYRVPGDQRNSAYLFQRDGDMDDSIGHRYDKIHLVPWGEFIPGKESMPFLYKLSVELGPKYYTDYIMEPGDTLTVFDLKSSDGAKNWRFVTPICFEDIDARICSAMFRPTTDGAKRADFIVNLTNDGWFKLNENADHLQAASFRSIENRAWTARSVNTGISGFIDSVGRCSDLVPVRTEGASVRQIMIDRRLSFYTRYGDLFAFACDAAAIAIIGTSAWKKWSGSRRKAES